MRIRLRVSTDLSGNSEISEVIHDLEQHLGPQIPHKRMTMRGLPSLRGFVVGRGWAIDHCIDHCGDYWCVRMDARTARKPWAVAFRLKWS